MVGYSFIVSFASVLGSVWTQLAIDWSFIFSQLFSCYLLISYCRLIVSNVQCNRPTVAHNSDNTL